MNRFVALLAALSLSACTGQEVFEDIVRAEPGEVTFSWDPAQPLSGEIDIPTTVRVTNTATEGGTIVIPDVPGLAVVGVGGGGPGSGVRVFRDDANSRWVATVRDRDGFDLHVTVTECFEGARTIPIEAESSAIATVSQTIHLRVRNTFSAGGPPGPGPGPAGTIPSNLTTISGIAGIVDAAGETKIFLTGEGGSEIVDPVTGAIEYELPTLDGLDGTAAFTSGGQAIYTVVLDAVSGAVRFESFDAATGQPRTGTSFPAEQWVLGAPSEPLVPVRLRGTVFTAPGAFGVYDAWKSEPGPVLDGEETVQPLVRVDTVGDARRVRRALRADTTGQDVLGLHFNDGEDFTYVSRLKAGPADNPANFFEATATIPAAVDRFVPFGDAMLAWKNGDTTAYLYRRDGAGDLTVPDGTVDMPADVIDAQAAVLAPGETPRVFLLCPAEIVERSFPPGGAPARRTIGFPPGTPREFLVAGIGGEESAAILFEDGVRILPLGE